MPPIESRTELINVRGLRYNVRHWGDANAPKLFLLHGWMDCSATFQFVVDALKKSWHVIAPDWRGYGASEWLSRPYWFPDYYADLNDLLNEYSPNQPARLVGHSMGANIASIYAGICPERVAQVVMLDFLGLKPPKAIDAPTQIGKWLKAIQAEPKLSSYLNCDALARRLRVANPRLTESRATYLSQVVSRIRPDGKIEMACDPWHKIPSPAVYVVEDAMASWRKIVAPVLMLIADQGFVLHRFGNDSKEYHRRLGSFKNNKVITIANSGHNVQHDQPENVALALENFLIRD